MESNLNGMMQQEAELDLEPCPHCNRTFNPDVLEKHAAICSKGLKKRQVFDSSIQRREGFKLFYTGRDREREACSSHSINKLSNRSPLQPTAGTSTQKSLTANKPSRSDSAKQPKRKPVTKKAPAPGSTISRESTLNRRLGTLSLERCPYCERSFNQKAIDSHIAFCREKSIEASFCIGYGRDDTLLAKKRMEARMKYKPPLPKSKHSSN